MHHYHRDPTIDAMRKILHYYYSKHAQMEIYISIDDIKEYDYIDIRPYGRVYVHGDKLMSFVSIMTEDGMISDDDILYDVQQHHTEYTKIINQVMGWGYFKPNRMDEIKARLAILLGKNPTPIATKHAMKTYQLSDYTEDIQCNLLRKAILDKYGPNKTIQGITLEQLKKEYNNPLSNNEEEITEVTLDDTDMIMYGIDEYFPCEVHNHYTNVFNPLSVSINFSPKSEYDTSDMSD